MYGWLLEIGASFSLSLSLFSSLLSCICFVSERRTRTRERGTNKSIEFDVFLGLDSIFLRWLSVGFFLGSTRAEYWNTKRKNDGNLHANRKPSICRSLSSLSFLFLLFFFLCKFLTFFLYILVSFVFFPKMFWLKEGSERERESEAHTHSWLLMA